MNNPPPSPVESLQWLAQKVQYSDPDGRERLLLLSEAVKNNVNTGPWVHADVREMIAPDSIVECYRNDRRMAGTDRVVALLEGFRNSLIFLPIIVTWFGISQATNKYNDYIHAAVIKHDTERYTLPFLYLWQQRFDGTLPEAWTLSNVAIADVGILLFILALTLIAFILAHNNATRKDAEARLLSANLNHAITRAILSLGSQPQLTASNNLEEVARGLNITVSQVVNQVRMASQQSANDLNRMAMETTNGLNRMAMETTTRLDTLSKETTNRFETMARGLTGQFVHASMQNRQQLDTVVKDIIKQVEAGEKYLQQMGSLTSGVIKTASEMQGTAEILKTSNISLIDSINNLVAPARDLSQQQMQLLDVVQRSVGLLQGNATAINNLATEQHTMSQDLAKTLDTLVVATEGFATLGQEQSELVSRHGDFLHELQVEHRKQGELASMLSDATLGVKSALSEMKDGAISLRSMAVSMDEMMRSQARIVSNPGMAVAADLSHITASYENAAQTMERSGNTLNASAIAIQRASQQLRDVLDSLK